jgi:ABC-2 type transport system permease protein
MQPSVSERCAECLVSCLLNTMPDVLSSPRPASPSYLAVFGAFCRNSLIRDMTFRANFLLDAFTSMIWVMMNLGLYLLIFQYTPTIGADTGWGKFEFFVFLSTTLFVNSVVQAFFMPNAADFSELIRTGNLDFALLKPIDTQFLVSLAKVEWSSLANFFFAAGLLAFSLAQLEFRPSTLQMALYPLYVLCGVGIMYSLMISLASASVWLGRNQGLYDFWFYITNFARYPMEIYQGPVGAPLRFAFTFIVPVLVVVNVPARLLTRPFDAANWYLALFALLATAVCLFASRWWFQFSLGRYRSASS